MTHSDIHVEVEHRQHFEKVLQQSPFAILLFGGLFLFRLLGELALDLVLGL